MASVSEVIWENASKISALVAIIVAIGGWLNRSDPIVFVGAGILIGVLLYEAVTKVLDYHSKKEIALKDEITKDGGVWYGRLYTEGGEWDDIEVEVPPSCSRCSLPLEQKTRAVNNTLYWWCSDCEKSRGRSRRDEIKRRFERRFRKDWENIRDQKQR